MKEPIPFSQVNANPWLLDSSTNLADYATHVFRAERLLDVWTNREEKYLHAILHIGYCTSSTLIVLDRWLTWFTHQKHDGETFRTNLSPLVVAIVAPLTPTLYQLSLIPQLY